MNDIFKKLSKYVDCESLFKLGPYNRFSDSVRIILPNLSNQAIDDAVQIVLSRLSEVDIENGGFIALLFDEYDNALSTGEIEMVNKCGIATDELVGEFNYYDDELYHFVNAYKCSYDDIVSAIKGKLSRHLDKEPYYMAELFIITPSLDCVVNLYDDRGIDVVKLKKC